jgi:hypothetical protein
MDDRHEDSNPAEVVPGEISVREAEIRTHGRADIVELFGL